MEHSNLAEVVPKDAEIKVILLTPRRVLTKDCLSRAGFSKAPQRLSWDPRQM